MTNEHEAHGKDGTREPPRALLSRLVPFVVAPRWRFARLDMQPLGVPIAQEHRFDILSTGSAPFLDKLVHLDRLTFGSVGMPMPAWLFNDISALPGAIVGLGLRARDFPVESLARLGFEDPPLSDPDGLVPLSMFIAVPARPPHVWYGHNLASLNAQVPELGLTGLGGVTKALGLSIMRCTEQLGATQWDSNALHVHTRFGPLKLLTAWTPAHSKLATLTYRLRVTEAGIADVLDGRRSPLTGEAFWVAAQDHPSMRDLQERIERGERFAIVGPPVRGEDGATRVPVGGRAANLGSNPASVG